MTSDVNEIEVLGVGGSTAARSSTILASWRSRRRASEQLALAFLCVVPSTGPGGWGQASRWVMTSRTCVVRGRDTARGRSHLVTLPRKADLMWAWLVAG